MVRSGAPYFDGKDASDFLQKMCDTCLRSGIKGYPGILEFIPQYCASHQRRWVERQSSWKNNDWGSFKKSFLDHYYYHDSEQQRFTTRYLERLSQTERTTEDDIEAYLDEFEDISDELTKRGKLGVVERIELFICGLPEDTQYKVNSRYVKKDLPGSCRITYGEAFTLAETRIHQVAKKRHWRAWREGRLLPKLEQRLSTKEKYPEERYQEGPAEQSVSGWGGYHARQLNEISSKVDSLALMLQANEDLRNDYRYKPTRRGLPNGVGMNKLVKCWGCGGIHPPGLDQCDDTHEPLTVTLHDLEHLDIKPLESIV